MASRQATGEQATRMRSPVNWVVLGLVIDRTDYGLSLVRRYEREYGSVLPISGASHVYHALKALVGQGLAEQIGGAGSLAQPKVRYRATRAGIDGHREWLIAQVRVDVQRQEMLVRQLALLADDPVASRDVLDAFEREHLRNAGTIGAAPRAPAGSRAYLTETLIAQRHRHTIAGITAWIHDTRAELELRRHGPA